ncbi:MAG: AraC family transcriptional regulator [Candidatus Cloacimonetes bacterium]|nr:AraC family transcriptional regulator [Candidatus Cloacimonadota bacterium]
MTSISQLMDSLTKGDGLNQTYHDCVKIYKASKYVPPGPLIYQQGIIIVGQGNKVIHVGEQTYRYNPNSYLVVSVPIPAECETFGSPKEPFICMSIDIDMKVLNNVIDTMHQHRMTHSFKDFDQSQSLFVTNSTKDFNAIVVRLLHSLKCPVESTIVTPGIISEIIYKIMCSENASALYALTAQNTTISKIDKSLKQIHSEFNKSVNVEQLANLSHMSISGFHRAFKEITSCSPIQYVKKVRLNKARNMLSDEKLKVNSVARNVGYESVTQFSREFKRYFGYPPSNLNQV